MSYKKTHKKNGKSTSIKNKTTSFAHKHWRAFEELSLKIIQDHYKEQPGKVSMLTSGHNDGGYDGIICFPASTDDATELYKVLLEAKLRSADEQALPLSDFSKTIIVAVNTIADKVYISTNVYFSEETNRRLQIFSQRIGLAIRTLDIKDISDWLKSHPEQIKQFEDQTLLQSLLNAHHNPRYRMLSIEYEEAEEFLAERLIGKDREILCNDLKEKLKGQNGSICIRGVMGSGKSILIDNIILGLHPYYKNIARLDFTQFSDARSVFIRLLAFVWGETANDIYGMSMNDLADVTEYLGDSRFPEKSRSALIQMIHQPQKDFDANQNLHSELLLDYLKKIVPPVIRRVRSLVIVRNVKNATEVALDFLIGFIRVLPGLPISFLIELEENEKSCEYLQQNIEQTQFYMGTFDLPKWDFEAADQFLSVKAPAVSEIDRRRLIEYFGKLPLALSAGLDIFCQSDFGKTFLQISTTLPQRSNTYFQYSLGHLDYVIEQFASSKGPEVQCVLVLLGLFDGIVKVKWIEQIIAVLNCPSPLPSLYMCSFIKCDREHVRVQHGAYVNSIRKFQFISKSFLFQILSQVETDLDHFFQDVEYVLKKRFEILCLYRDFERLDDLWLNLSKLYLQRGERHLAYHVLKTVYEWWMENPTRNRLTVTEQYWILYHLTTIGYELFGASEVSLDHYLKQVDTLLNLSITDMWPDGPNDLRRAKAAVLNIKGQIALGNANYEQMLMYTEEGIKLLMDGPSQKDLYYLGALWANKALALKHLKGISACVRFLESGKDLLDGIKPFCHCYYTHLSSFYSVKEPRKALEYFRLVNQKYNDTLSQYLHTDHNIATMHFVLGEYDEALKISGQVWIRAYENHIPIEEGRSDHLLGCLAWVKEDLEQAYDRFSTAYRLFQRHVHHTHIWPPLINLTLLCMEMGRKDESLKYAGDAIDFLLEHHLDAINHLDFTTIVLPKLFVAILLLLDCIEQIDRSTPAIKKLWDNVKNPQIQKAYCSFVVTCQLDKLLEKSGYICGGKRMLKI